MNPYGSLCAKCKGRLWCGREKCPILEKARAYKRIGKRFRSKELFGASPPAAFIGRYGYPKVNVGPLIPPKTGDTKIFDDPATWFRKGFGIPKILKYRGSLVDSRSKLRVRSASNPNERLRKIQLIAMASESIDTEVTLKKRLRPKITFNLRAAPYGPSGEAERVRLAENVKIKRKVDYVVSDELKANQAIFKLYNNGLDVYQLSRMLSVGLFGLKKQRRLVPTRWSITATDSTIAKNLLDQVKDCPPLAEYRLFSGNYLGNYFEIVLLPTKWQFEHVEMFAPGGMWTKGVKKPTVISDYETYFGRKKYAKTVAGAYYSSKLAVLEHLNRIKKQAGVLVIREIRPIYPPVSVGVWKIRTCVRAAMEKGYQKFEDLRSVIQRVDQKLKIGSRFWIPKSKIIEKELYQRKIKDYLS